MECRPDCAACCIAPSISSHIPGTDSGKAADERCYQLSDDNLCRLFNSNLRPAVCASLQPSIEMCGGCREEALEILTIMEKLTQPDIL